MPSPFDAVSPLRVRRLTAAATVSAIALSLVMASAQPTPETGLTLVSTAWPPFTNVKGNPRFALDLVEAALGRVGIRAETKIVSAGEFTPALLTGAFDGSAAAWRDAQREQILIFSEPYLENRLVLVGRHGANVSATTLGALSGKRIAIVGGYSYGDAVDTAAGLVVVRSESEEDSLTKLLKAEVDYTLMDELVVQYIISNYPKQAEARLQIGTTPLVTRALYLAVRRARADAATIISRFNAQLRGMIADRTYHKLLHVDWLRADITGDGIPEYVPASDQAGPTEPTRIYSLFTGPRPISESTAKTGFYLGGTIYSDWASVPDNYKVVHSQYPDPRRSTASIFKFTW